jgi:sugar lactone lactonase YvrE
MKTPLIVSAVAVLAVALVPSSGLAAPGDLYVTASDTIFKFTQDGTKTTFASGLSGALGLAFDGSGNLFVAEFDKNRILKFAPDGTRSVFAGGIVRPFGLAFDRAGNLFAVDGGANAVFKYTPDGTKTTFAAGFAGPAGLACDRLGNVFVADSVGNQIVKVTPTGVQTTFASSGLNQPFALTFDSSGTLLFVADFGSGTIFRYSGGTRAVIASGLNGPEGLAFDSAGNLFETDNGSGTIFIFTPSQFPFATGVSGMTSLAFEPTRHQFLNVSTRALVGTGDNVLIGGFIMNGNGQVDEAVVVRALGPSLTAFGVAGALQDPTLELRSADGALIATNDNWKTSSDGGSQQALITSTGVAPSDDRESAIYARLPAGHYTPIVRGAGGTTGVAIVEVYNLQ